MKILSVRFNNLNSLVGEWLIDFSHPEYQNEGIFAITGPTGVGKSTLLDAICLALYGRTPRLNTISANNNEIMSRHTGECMAEVCFQNKKGTYRAYWYQHRANQKSNGSLQAAKREITEHLTGQLLANSISQVQNKIIELTGMDFERFTRSMLLAQGSFAAFLQANTNDRSALLEQINGTQIYSQISQKVFEINKQYKDEISQQETAIAAFNLLSPDVLEQLLIDETNKQKQQIEVKQAIESESQAIKWHEQIKSLETGLNEANSAQQELLLRLEQAEPEKIQLRNATKAMQLEAEYALLNNNQASLLATEQKIKEFSSQLPQLDQQIEQAAIQTQNTKEKVETLRQKHDVLIEVLKKVRALDTLIDERKKALNADNETLEQNKKQTQNIKNFLKANQTKLELVKKDLLKNSEEISVHQNLSGLTSELPLLNNLINSTSKKAFDIQNKNKEIDHETNNIANKTKFLNSELNSLELLDQEKIKTKENSNHITNGLSKLLGSRELKDFNKEDKELQNTLHALSSIRKDAVVCLDIQVAQHNNHKRVNQLQVQQENFNTQKNQKEIEIKLLEKNKTLLEKEYLLKQSIASLSELRAQLEEGQACALCGSLDHPYAKGLIPEVDDSQAQLNEIKKQITTSQDELRKAENELTKTIQELELLTNNIKTQEPILAEKNDNLEKNLAPYFNHTKLTLNKDQLASVVGTIDEKIIQINTKQQELQIKIHTVEQLEQEQENLQIKISELEGKINTQKLLTTQLTIELEQHQSNLTRIKAENTKLDQEFSVDLNQVVADLTQLGITDININSQQSCNLIIQKLKAKLELWQELQATQLNLENEITGLNATIQAQIEQVAKQVEQLEVLQSNYEVKNAELNLNVEKRSNLFADKNTDVEEQLSQQQLRQTEELFTQQTNHITQLKQDQQNLNLQISENKNTFDELLHQNIELALLFQNKCTNLGFRSKEEYLASCLDNTARDNLTNKLEKLNHEKVAIETTIQNLASNLSLEKNKNLSSESLENHRLKLEDLKQQLLANENELGGIKAQLANHQQQFHKVYILQEQLQLQKTEAKKWSNLNSLIGSADGKLYRNFVQGITFEILIQFANQQLQKISDRYLLIQSLETPLELKVIDSYQANEVRSTQNLSGGETFLISLSLALGLSKMASDTVSVDTLFLDEGFGTLDEDTLETALNTLSSLQNEGKLIGIISHIAALKERIHTQIKVSPLRHGQSKIEGPGCSKK